MLEVQKDLRERAIRGEFAPERLEELKKTLRDKGFEHLHERHAAAVAAAKGGAGAAGTAGRPIPKEWDRIHPGDDDDDDDE